MMVNLLVIGLLLFTPPTTVEKKPKEEHYTPYPKLPKSIGWGNVHQEDDMVTITGHCEWSARGTWIKGKRVDKGDYRLKITWTTTRGYEGTGLYMFDIETKLWRGLWGYEAWFDNEGTIHNAYSGDTWYPK